MTDTSSVRRLLCEIEEYLGLNEFKFSEENKLIHEELQKKIQNEKLRICVMALTKAGKTTFVNALVGDQLLHVSNVPATCGITFISHTPTPTNELYEMNKDGSRGKLIQQGTSEDIFKAVGEVNTALREGCNRSLQQENPNPASTTINASSSSDTKIAETSSREELELVTQVTCFSGVPIEKTNIIQIVDTPGRNEAANDLVRRKADEYMTTADVIIFLFNYNYLRTNDEMAMWSQLAQSRPELLQLKSDRIYYVINQFDCQRSSGLNEQRVKEFVQNSVKEYCGFEPPLDKMYCTSALRALYARLVIGDKLKENSGLFNDILLYCDLEVESKEDLVKARNWSAMLNKSGIPQFEAAVMTHITEKAWNMYQHSVVDMATKLVTNTCQILGSELFQQEQSLEENEKVIISIKKAQVDIESFIQSRFKPWFHHVDDLVNTLLDNFFVNIQALADELESESVSDMKKVTVKGKGPEKAMQEVMEFASKQVKIVVNNLSVQLASRITGFEANMKSLSLKANEEFKILLNDFHPLLDGIMKKYGIENLVGKFEYPEQDPMERLIETVRESLKIDWDSIRSQLNDLVVANTEKVEELRQETKKVEYQIPVPHVTHSGSFWKKLFGGGTKIDFKSETRSLDMPHVVAHLVEYEVFSIDAKEIMKRAVKLMKNSAQSKHQMLKGEVSQLLEATVGCVWKQYLTASTTLALETAEMVLVVKQSNQEEQAKAKEDLEKSLNFFQQLKQKYLQIQ